jgi:hypothetical protein
MFLHRDLIAEKLEIARTLGLVTKYFIRPVETASGSDLSVRVWQSPGTTEAAIREYLSRLLDGLVSDQDLVVTGDGEVARPEPVPRISAAA